MINENEVFVLKSKLKIAVKTLSKDNGRSRVAARQTNKQTNRQTDKQRNSLGDRNWQTFRQEKKRHTYE